MSDEDALKYANSLPESIFTARLNTAERAASSVSMKQQGRSLYGEQTGHKKILDITVYRFGTLRWLVNDAVRISD